MKKEFSITEKLPSKLILAGGINTIICILILFCISTFIEYKETIKTSLKVLEPKIELPQNSFESKAGFTAAVKLSDQEWKKIKKGQAIFIRLNEFPYQEFGVLKGEIWSIKNIDASPLVHVTILLNEAYESSYGKTLQLTDLTNGQAEIIIAKHKLANKLWKT